MSAHRSGRMLVFWGRALLIWGLAGALLSAAPALLFSVMPGFDPEFLGVVAALLTLMVTPLMVVVASVGAILLLAASIRRLLDRT